MAKSFPGERGKRLGLFGVAENAGVVLGPVLGLPLPRDAPPRAASQSGATR